MEKIKIEYETPIKMGENINLKLKISNEFGFLTDVRVLFNRNNQKPGEDAQYEFEYCKEESSKDFSVYKANVDFKKPGYRAFFIELKVNGISKKIEYDKDLKQAVLINTDEYKDFWNLFVYYPYLKTPDWVKGGIMYQIYVDTFYSEGLPEEQKKRTVSWDTTPKWTKERNGRYINDQFYGGNLKGIIKKLDYIKSLNVSVIYLTPIFKSLSQNRYDTVDYEEIDDMVGTWDDLKKLHEKANKMGISVVIDIVFNHSGRTNKLIKEDPEMYDWIKKYSEPKCWWDYPNLPEFNKYSPNYFKHLKKWLLKYQKYVDGIRLDVADNLPDFVLKYIKRYFPKYVLGEVWKNAIIGDYREFFYGDELDGVMNYQFANAIYRYIRWHNSKYFKDLIETICNLYPSENLDVSPIFLSSHDIPRISNILAGDFMKEDVNYENVWDMERDDFWYVNGEFSSSKFRRWELGHEKIPEDIQEKIQKQHFLAVFMQYTLPGLPSVFAGDEIGTIGFKDPFNRKTFKWDKVGNYMYKYYCSIGKFRNENKENFKDSRNFKFLKVDEEKCIYQRGNLICIANISDHDIYLEEYNLKNAKFSSSKIKDKNTIPAYSSVVLEENRV